LLERKCFFDVLPLIFFSLWRRPSYRHCLDAGACQENNKKWKGDGERRAKFFDKNCWCNTNTMLFCWVNGEWSCVSLPLILLCIEWEPLIRHIFRWLGPTVA
jgi:hypothetical protein